MADNISKYHGVVKECTCGTTKYPERQSERSCRLCFGRGFVAECLACEGKGQVTVPVNNGNASLGMMGSTCIPCGGNGLFGVNRPHDWVDKVPTEAAQTVAAV